jgi:hypothetical protein
MSEHILQEEINKRAWERSLNNIIQSVIKDDTVVAFEASVHESMKIKKKVKEFTQFNLFHQQNWTSSAEKYEFYRYVNLLVLSAMLKGFIVFPFAIEHLDYNLLEHDVNRMLADWKQAQDCKVPCDECNASGELWHSVSQDDCYSIKCPKCNGNKYITVDNLDTTTINLVA